MIDNIAEKKVKKAVKKAVKKYIKENVHAIADNVNSFIKRSVKPTHRFYVGGI